MYYFRLFLYIHILPCFVHHMYLGCAYQFYVGVRLMLSKHKMYKQKIDTVESRNLDSQQNLKIWEINSSNLLAKFENHWNKTNHHYNISNLSFWILHTDETASMCPLFWDFHVLRIKSAESTSFGKSPSLIKILLFKKETRLNPTNKAKL